MQFTKKLPDGQTVIIRKAFWTGKTEVRLDNGIIGTMGLAREQSFPFKYKDGTGHTLKIKHHLLDPMPFVFLDGHDVFASQRFNKLQTAIICLPALLVLKLGAVPALIGVGSVYLNFFVARRQSWDTRLRWLSIGIVPVIGLAVVLLVNDLAWKAASKGTIKTGYYLQTTSTTHKYDPSEDDRNPRLWAHPSANPTEAERQRRWVEEGR
jgi:hypothetical protein